jgi:hypothetical protein
MLEVIIEIIRYVDDAQPGWVECQLTDAWGHQHIFRDKVPIFTSSDLTSSSIYPQEGRTACLEVCRLRDKQGREIVTIDTENPWRVESLLGETRFDVLAEQLAGQ